jgi:tetratricopeptide (TPR) repeat protein
MNRLVCAGLALILTLGMANPGWSQGGENAAWQAIEDQRDARRKAELLESFIRSYQNSPHRPDADKLLVNFWADNKDFQKIMNHAETNFRLQQTSADAASKALIYTQAMMAAVSLNNVAKVGEFSKYALEADPNNLTVLILLAGSNLPDPKTAMQHAQKAVTVPRPANMPENQWQTMQFRAHSILGNFYFAENKFKEANAEYALALKSNPKDHATQFRAGFSSLNLATLSAQGARTANDDRIKAMGAKASAAELAELEAKQTTFEKEALMYRDEAFESMAKAVVLSGPNSQFASQAKQLFDNLYLNKNKSMDGAEQFLAQKKTELGL